MVHGKKIKYNSSVDLYDGGYASFNHPVEDPTLWVTSDGTWHMLTHAFRMGMVNRSGGNEANGYGGYAWSPGPNGPWTFQENKIAYDSVVQFEDGSCWTLYKRERPKILTNNKGVPTHLYNGVCPPGSNEEGLKDPHGHCFTMVQKIDPNVFLWNHPRN